MSQPYLVATSGLLARKTVRALRRRIVQHEPYEAYDSMRLLMTHLETIRFHDEDAFIAAMDNVIQILKAGALP